MKKFASIALLLCLAVVLVAAPKYEPTPANLESRRWFQQARFGLFIHWGVYSVLGDGEWVMNQKKMTVAEYEKLPPQFNPVEFDAAEWVALAKKAGMKYITITSKHHDGFAMFDSKQTEWDIVDRTPYKKDVLKMLAEECRRQGVKLFFYHSQLDWHHPDYFPRGRTGKTAGRPESGEWNRYLDFMDAQLSELLTNYGPIGGIWFDGSWDKPDADWRLEQTYGLIHRLQPAALIGSNHHQAPFDGEDFQMFEKDLPGHNTSGFSGEAKIGVLPLETCDTIGRAWGYNASDKNWKSSKELIHYLVRAAGYGANFLLNVGPRPDGTIQPEFVERLGEIGAWLDKNGETIYATQGGPVRPHHWGATTRKGNKIYVHLLDPQGELVAMPALNEKIASAKLLASGKPVEFDEHRWGLLLKVPLALQDSIDTIVVLETK